MARANVVGIIVGARGTGKTDYTKNELILHSPFSKKLIVDTFDSAPWRNMKTFLHPENENIPISELHPSQLAQWKSGLYRMYSSDTKEMMRQIQLHLKNALVIFEDATKYVGSRFNDDMRKFVLDSKQKNLDIFFVFHSLGQVPNDLIRAADVLTLFKTNEGQPSENKYPFPQIPIMMEELRNSKNRFENITTRLN